MGVGRLQVLPELLHLADSVLLVLPLGLAGVELIPQLSQLLLDVRQPGLGQLVILLLQGGLLNLALDNLPGDHVQLSGHGVHLRADESAGLVNEVDGLVGQETVGDIAVGEGGGGHDGPVGDLDAMEHLIALLQAT